MVNIERKKLEQVLESLETGWSLVFKTKDALKAKDSAITAIKEALAQPEQRKVAFMAVEDGRISFAAKILPDGTYDLYTTPPAAQPAQEPDELELLRDEIERVHVENRRLIDRIETIGVPIGVGGFATTTSTPSQRPWVGLTDDEIKSIWELAMFIDNGKHAALENQPFIHFAHAVEAKLKEKNT